VIRLPRAALVAWALLLAACVPGRAARSPDPAAVGRVALIVVDGLDARDLTDADMPWLAHAWRTGAWCGDVHGIAAMPARTNVNHATLTTGVEPEAHGVTGNAFWGRAGDPPRKLGAAGDFLVETLFTVAGGETPPLRTAAAVGKAKLQLMFTTAASRQAAPTEVWSPSDAAAGEREPVTGYAYDAATLTGARKLIDHGPAFLLVNLADVDRVSHGTGPRSEAARATRAATDRALGAFVDDLLARPEWRHGTVVITADHGFDAVTHPAIDFRARLRAARLDSGLVSVSDGGVAHVYLRRERPDAADAPTTLAAARRAALATEGLAEALYLAPNPADGGDAALLGRVHPEWRLDQERSGDLLLVAAPGFVLADADEVRLLGNHGASGETDVPVVVVGDAERQAGGCGRPRAADIGATLFGCLGLRPARRLDGGSIADTDRGHRLTGICRDSGKVRALNRPVT
jgi:hypothetical protein